MGKLTRKEINEIKKRVDEDFQNRRIMVEKKIRKAMIEGMKKKRKKKRKKK